MIRVLSKYMLEIFGWKLAGSIPEEKKYVVIVAPHTTNWDYVIGQLYCLSLGIKAKMMIKKELFHFPLNILLRALGGVAVDRNRKTDIVDQMIEQFKVNESFILAITPEGTRKRVSDWKTGFYRIAIGANVPVLLGFIDYKKRVVGTGDLYYLSGNMDADMLKIKKFYCTISPKYPENFSAGNIE